MTEKQRKFIESICKTLNIQYDETDSTADARKWISEHIDEFNAVEKIEQEEMSGCDGWAILHGYV